MNLYEFKCNTSTKQDQVIAKAIQSFQYIRNKSLHFWAKHTELEKELPDETLKCFLDDINDAKPFLSVLAYDSQKLAAIQTKQTIKKFFQSGKHKLPEFKKNQRSIDFGANDFTLNTDCTEITFFKIGTLPLTGDSKGLKSKLDKNHSRLKKATLIKRLDGYYVRITIDTPERTKPHHQDLKQSIKVITHIEASEASLKTQQVIAKTQKKISKKSKGSANCIKLKNKLNLKLLKLRRQLKALASNIAKAALKSHDLVVYTNKQVLPPNVSNNESKSFLWEVFTKELTRQTKFELGLLYRLKSNASYDSSIGRYNAFLNEETRLMPLDKQMASAALQRACEGKADVYTSPNYVERKLNDTRYQYFCGSHASSKNHLETGSTNTSNNSTVRSTGTGLSDMFKMSGDQKACGQDSNRKHDLDLGGIRKVKKIFTVAQQNEPSEYTNADRMKDLYGDTEL